MCETLSLSSRLSCRDVEEPAVAQRIQAAAESADPQRAVRMPSTKRPDLVARKTVGGSVRAAMLPVLQHATGPGRRCRPTDCRRAFRRAPPRNCSAADRPGSRCARRPSSSSSSRRPAMPPTTARRGLRGQSKDQTPVQRIAPPPGSRNGRHACGWDRRGWRSAGRPSRSSRMEKISLLGRPSCCGINPPGFSSANCTSPRS